VTNISKEDVPIMKTKITALAAVVALLTVLIPSLGDGGNVFERRKNR
jgi:hypothetical protein